nr:hypothetical protein [Methanosarcina lacustris]
MGAHITGPRASVLIHNTSSGISRVFTGNKGESSFALQAVR